MWGIRLLVRSEVLRHHGQSMKIAAKCYCDRIRDWWFNIISGVYVGMYFKLIVDTLMGKVAYSHCGH